MSGLAESIYFATPIWTQQAIIAGYGWWWYKRRFGPHFNRLVTEFKRRENWTAEEFRFYQEQQLGKILAAAWRSPYYREVFREAGVSPGMQPFDTLRRLPLLSKE